MKQKIRHLFATNTAHDEVHHTSDGILFFNRSLAVAHANTLENKEIVTTNRAEAAVEETDSDVLASIRARKEEIMKAVAVYEPEFKELTAKEEALLEKLAKAGETDEDREAAAKAKAERDAAEAEEKAAEAKAALIARALAVNLTEEATEEEIVAAEKLAAKPKTTKK